jgi:hypothetical protein
MLKTKKLQKALEQIEQLKLERSRLTESLTEKTKEV